MTESAFSIPDNPVTSPDLPADAGFVHSPKEFSDALTLDLTDEEIQKAMELILQIRRKWSAKFRAKFSGHGGFTVDEAFKMLNDFEVELKDTLADKMDLLISVDMEPVVMGQPPTIVLEGALPSHSSAKYGLDHEKKGWEVKKAKEKNESFLGESKLSE